MLPQLILGRGQSMKVMAEHHSTLMIVPAKISSRRSEQFLRDRPVADPSRFAQARWILFRNLRGRESASTRNVGRGVVVGGVGEVEVKPMTNPVTGSIFRAIIELPAGFDSDRIETSSLEKLVVHDGYLKFKYVGTYGSFMQASWKGP